MSKVAAIATPALFRMSDTGFARWNCWQPRLVKDALRSFERKVSRLSAVAVTGDWPVASSFWLAARNGV